MSHPLRAATVAALLSCAPPPARPAAVSRTAQVQPSVVEWSVGITDKDGPTPLIETVLPTTYQGRPVWRVVHRDGDPTSDGAASWYDLYDVDRATLAPVRSVMHRDGSDLVLTFQPDRVTIDRRTGDEHNATEVMVRDPMPEGPGESVLLSSLPLAVGYRTSFDIVDRWDEAHPVKRIDLSVERADPLQTPLGRCDVVAVVLAPRDGSFRIREWRRSAPPHHPVKTEYTRGPLVLVSEVRLVVAGDVAPCEPP